MLLNLFAHALERIPVLLLIHKLAVAKTAFGPPSVSAAEYLIPIFHRSCAAGTFGRVFGHTIILL